MVDVIIDKKNTEYLRKYFRFTNDINLSDNQLMVTLVFDNTHSAKRTLVGFMVLIVDIKNDDLKDTIKNHIRSLCD
ncbi:hypothetical protein [Salinicoccus sp. YB14-2]|uniref:hypothetical protein n=1 Tax=Salinicoccus sp. YB14-2 TaxID=1572701 RepID=UPI00068B40FA|nr:hypothetical protein [Salinicoccus sp. YB14-2]